MNQPRLSVVLSVFNGEDFLRDCIESVLKQTFKDFEFIIVDDGSTDSTAQIISSFAASDPRVRSFRHSNKGRALSLNDGIEAANSDLIARIDADDVALPDRFKKQVSFMEMHTQVGVVGSAAHLIAPDGRKLATVQPPLSDSEIRQKMLSHNVINHPTAVMRRELVAAVGGYRRQLVDCDDYDLFFRIGERSTLANLPEVLLLKRVHRNEASVQNLTHQTLSTIAARRAADFRKNGRPDPLDRVEEITPAFLREIGVDDEEVRETLIGTYAYWADLLETVDSEYTLNIVEQLLELCPSNRSLVSNALLAAAKIYWMRGDRAKALWFAGRALMWRPIVAGRPIKRAFLRLANGREANLSASQLALGFRRESD